MTYILRSTVKFEPDELIKLLGERPSLLHPRIRFLQGPFSLQNLGNLDLLGLDDQGGWALVKIAGEGNGELLFAALNQVAWIQDHSEWIATLPSYDVADPASVPTVFLVASHFNNSLSEVLRYVHNVTVGLVKYTGFDMGDQKAIHFEPLFQSSSADDAAVYPVSTAAQASPEDSEDTPEAEPPAQESPPNVSLLHPLSDEEIAEFLPGAKKEELA